MNGQMFMGKASWTFLFFLVRPSLRVVSVFLGTPLAQHRHGEMLQMRFFSAAAGCSQYVGFVCQLCCPSYFLSLQATQMSVRGFRPHGPEEST